MGLIDPGFWRGKRVFLTGHTGFKGSWLSFWLSSLGARVTGYSLEPDTDPNLFAAAGLSDQLDSRIGDIRSFDALAAAMKHARPDIVLHLAAQALVRRGYAEPLETYHTNVLGTANLLQAARAVDSIRAIVVVTSDKCYDNDGDRVAFRETDAMGGHDPYSSSKGCTELVASAFRSSYFNPAAFDQHRCAIATARAGNVIGGGDWSPDRLVPDLVRGFATNQPVAIRYPHARRPWQHVLEPLSGYLALAQRLFTDGTAFAQAWNFGPETADVQPVSWIADAASAAWGGDARWARDPNPGPAEASYLALDWSKAFSQLSWRPAWRLNDALRRTVNWYRSYNEDTSVERARALMNADILAHSATQDSHL